MVERNDVNLVRNMKKLVITQLEHFEDVPAFSHPTKLHYKVKHCLPTTCLLTDQG